MKNIMKMIALTSVLSTPVIALAATEYTMTQAVTVQNCTSESFRDEAKTFIPTKMSFTHDAHYAMHATATFITGATQDVSIYTVMRHPSHMKVGYYPFSRILEYTVSPDGNTMTFTKVSDLNGELSCDMTGVLSR